MAGEGFFEKRSRLKREGEARDRTENIRKNVQTTSASLADLLKSGPVGEMLGAPISTEVAGPLEKPQAVDRAQLEKGEALESAIVDLAFRKGDAGSVSRLAERQEPRGSVAPKTSAPTDIDDFVRRANEESVRTTGKDLTPGNKNKAALKFKRAQFDEKKANRFATKSVDIATAGVIAQNKEKGKALAIIETAGDILKAKGIQTPVQKMKIAKGRMGKNLSTLAKLYLDLDSMGAITNVENGTMENIFAAARSSTVGQAFGRITGTAAQSVRKKINNLKPLLIQDIRQSTDMGARGLDSEKELEFYLQAATNEKADIQSNIAALIVLDSSFGDGKFTEILRDPANKKLNAFIDEISSVGGKLLITEAEIAETMEANNMTREEAVAQLRGAAGGQELPEGVTEEDIEETMRANQMTREEVLTRLQGGR